MCNVILILASYKLDAVSSHFMKGKVLKILESNIEYSCFETDNTKGIEKESYLVFTYYDGHSEEKHQKGHKYQVRRITDNKVYVTGKLGLGNYKYSWSMAKDDVSPQDILDYKKVVAVIDALLQNIVLRMLYYVWN